MTETSEDEYQGGYYDGLSDAINVVERAASTDEAVVLIKKLQGFIDCPSCSGTGERAEIIQQDLVKALLVSVGGRTDISRPCRTCWGNRVVSPATLDLQKKDA